MPGDEDGTSSVSAFKQAVSAIVSKGRKSVTELLLETISFQGTAQLIIRAHKWIWDSSSIFTESVYSDPKRIAEGAEEECQDLFTHSV